MTRRNGIVSELWQYMRARRAYWMAPILIVMLLLIGLVVAGGTGAAPFIYTLF